MSPWLRTTVSVGVVFFLLVGCSQKSSETKPDKSNEFFVSWFKSHGETNIVQDASGVGIAGNATRLRAELHDVSQPENGSVTAETEFRIRLPDGRQMVEYVAGTGKSAAVAEDDARLNFLLTTFHVVYRSFINPADPHQTEEKVTISGKPRVLIVGDAMTRSATTNSVPDLTELRSRFRELPLALPLSAESHWIKIVYAQHRGKVISCAVTLDNQESPALTAAVEKLPWAVQEEFYMVKQFIVIK